MTKFRIFAISFTLALLAGPLMADEAMDDPIENLMEGCAAEIENYCSQVTLGEGRLMACFFAHEDKLSNQCIQAVYDGAVALDAAINALVAVATYCETDIDEFCSEIEPGEGRILNCLTASRESLSADCSDLLSQLEE